MKITFDNPALRKNAIAVEAMTVSSLVTNLRQVVEQHDYTNPAASILLAGDPLVEQMVNAAIVDIDRSKLRYIFLVGIGGSNLGAKAMYEAMFWWSDMARIETGPRLICVDTNNPLLLATCEQLVESMTDPDEYIVVSISKSGGTTETIANTEVLLSMIDARWPGRADRIIVVGDEDSDYVTVAEALGVRTATLPSMVGGRYSVFSPVGLIPLALAGVEIRDVSAGAEAMLQECLHPEPTANPALASALVRLSEYRAGKTIHDWFTFHQELVSLGGWWRQLTGESLGKAGVNAVEGITPTVSVGSTDLHSVGQLYLGGPKDKFLTFIEVLDTTIDYQVPVERIFPNQVAMVSGVALTEIVQAISHGTKAACLERSVPFMTISFQDISAYELGQYMQYAMMETIYLGRLIGVNPFDQPDVEAYKKVTKTLLEEQTQDDYERIT